MQIRSRATATNPADGVGEAESVDVGAVGEALLGVGAAVEVVTEHAATTAQSNGAAARWTIDVIRRDDVVPTSVRWTLG